MLPPTKSSSVEAGEKSFLSFPKAVPTDLQTAKVFRFFFSFLTLSYKLAGYPVPHHQAFFLFSGAICAPPSCCWRPGPAQDFCPIFLYMCVYDDDDVVKLSL